ncbi:MAG: zinc ribbon domain-containing protein [Methyloprofundus sp.]|nr:zinc ribbon domain-containing protein [Methyloprofundus sp.]
MPIYEYQCQACGDEYEALQKLSAEPLVICPACHQPELKKKISAAGFRLKGSGWYETDFKSGNKKNVVGAEKSSPAASSAGD